MDLAAATRARVTTRAATVSGVTVLPAAARAALTDTTEALGQTAVVGLAAKSVASRTAIRASQAEANGVDVNVAGVC